MRFEMKKHCGRIEKALISTDSEECTVAKQLITQLTDDIDGTAIDDGSGESIEFSVNGVAYAIDLKSKNAAEFHRKLDYYISHAERIGGRKRRTTKAGAASTAGSGAAPTKRDREQTRQSASGRTATGTSSAAAAAFLSTSSRHSTPPTEPAPRPPGAPCSSAS